METALLTWWSVAHTLTGVAFGIGAYLKPFRNIKKPIAAVIVFALLVAWELFERYVISVRVTFGQELLRNRIADIVIGFVAYLISNEIIRRKFHPGKA